MKNKTLLLSVESICTTGQGSVNIAGVTFRLTAFNITGANRTIVVVFVGITSIIQLSAIDRKSTRLNSSHMSDYCRGVRWNYFYNTAFCYLRASWSIV